MKKTLHELPPAREDHGLPPIHTIGHSTRAIADFAAMLRAAEVDLLVDIRRVPRSRRNPQYNLEILPIELVDYGIGHMRIAELGGLRHASDVPADVNAFWTNRSFHSYADYALSESFQEGLERLLRASVARRTAIMCAEAVWWRCHRRIVADYLINAGRAVFHLMGKSNAQQASMTGAAVRFGKALSYPGQVLSSRL